MNTEFSADQCLYSVFALSTDTKLSFIANHSECVTDFPIIRPEKIPFYRIHFIFWDLNLVINHSCLVRIHMQKLFMHDDRHRRNFANNIWGGGVYGKWIMPLSCVP